MEAFTEEEVNIVIMEEVRTMEMFKEGEVKATGGIEHKMIAAIGDPWLLNNLDHLLSLSTRKTKLKIKMSQIAEVEGIAVEDLAAAL
jgi:hypothetical protein